MKRFVGPLLVLLFASMASCLPWSSLDPRGTGPLGSVTNGGLRGGLTLPPRGPYHAFYRPQRDRQTASAVLGAAVLRAAQTVTERYPGSVLVLGDLSARSGGAISGHRSHQNGLDADLGFFRRHLSGAQAEPGTDHRFDRFGVALVRGQPTLFDDERNLALVLALLRDPQAEVQWIFVSHGAGQRLLTAALRTGVDLELIERLAEVLRRPSDSSPHDDHFHVRVFCPQKAALCIDRGKAWPWTPKAQARRQPEWIDGTLDESSLGSRSGD